MRYCRCVEIIFIFAVFRGRILNECKTLSPYGDCEAESKIKADTTAVFIGLSIVMKLEELSQEDLSQLLRSLYNRYKLMSIELTTLQNKDEDKYELIKEYLSEILHDGLDEIILRNVGHDFDDDL